MLTWFFARHRGALGGPQIHDRPVLVGRPNRAVLTQETRAGTLFAAETEGAVEQPRSKPFEPHRHLAQLAAELEHHAIDDAAAHQCFADSRLCTPLGAMSEQVSNCHR